MIIRCMTAMAAVVMVTALLHGRASGSYGPQGRADRGGPPPEAVDACRNKSAGDPVEFTAPDGSTIRATCRQINGRLVAAPEGRPAGAPPGERGE